MTSGSAVSTRKVESPRMVVGRPPRTSLPEIESAAFSLFRDQGFDETTLEQIAAEAGISRRTIFRYFPSKNDIPWGAFDESLERLRSMLARWDDSAPIFDAIAEAIVRFNKVAPVDVRQHRERMELILNTPALLAHSALRYEHWRSVVAEFVARRMSVTAESLVPRTTGHLALGLALSAYEQWLQNEDADLEALMRDSAQAIRDIACG